jgi:copper chaperone CopZ
MRTATIEVQNLKCHGCANTIRTNLEKLEGIEEISVDNEKHLVSFTYSNDKLFNVVKEKLSALGYPSVDDHNPITKKAKSFVSCAVGRMNS